MDVSGTLVVNQEQTGLGLGVVQAGSQLKGMQQG